MKKLITASLCFICFSANSQSQKWDLKKCVDYAMKNNISVKQADVQARITALQLKQSELAKYPNVSFSTGIGPSFGRYISQATNTYTNVSSLSQSYGVQGGVEIYNWGRIKNNVLANQFNAKAALTDIEKAANDVALSVATYYLQILAANEQANIMQVQIAQTQLKLNVTRKKVDAGSLPELNAVELESQLATDSSNFISADINLKQAILNMKGLLNIDAALPFDVDIPNVEKIPLDNLSDLQPEAVYQLALNNQPAIKGNSLRMKSAEKDVLVAKAGMYPSITGSYSLNSRYYSKDENIFTGAKIPYLDQLNNNFGQSFGVGISVPIFNNGQYRINYEKSKLNLKSYTIAKEQIEQKLKLDIYTAYSNTVSALQKFNASKKQVDLAQKAYDFAVKRYDVGLLTTLDLITNQNNLLRAKTQLLSDQYDYVFKMKLLEFYKGNGLKL